MKKIVSLLLISLIIFATVPVSYAEDTPWQSAYRQLIAASAVSDFMLMDVSADGVPEFFCSNGSGVRVYYHDGNSVIMASDDASIPYEFVKNLVAMRDTKDNKIHYMGQTMHANKLITYKMSFLNCVPVLEVIAEQDPATEKGQFKGSGTVFIPCDNVTEKVTEYLESYEAEHLMKSCLESDEVYLFGRDAAASRLFGRYTVLSSFADDSFIFSANQREEIKKSVGMGRFLAFDKITVLNDDVIFIEYYTNNTPGYEYAFFYSKMYALVSGQFEIISSYASEQELDPDYLWSLISPETKPSNFNPEYDKTAGFRGIDDYVNYFSSLLTQSKPINENGKKEVANFMEYAVNKSSRTELKANNNVLTVRKDAVSIVSQSAANGMSQLLTVCQANGITQIRTAKTVPELVCTGLDLSKPIRIEFESGVAASIGQASGIRIMLDESHGVYVNAAELSVLEKETDVFAVEYTMNKEDYSIVFTGKDNQIISAISMPVWFVVPAKSDYSSVFASFDGGTENRGGQFDERYNTIEFSATRSGNYQVLEEDITINDIDSVSFSANQAIRFLVSKGVLEVDRKNNFYPNSEMSRYDFTKALVNMFYAVNADAVCSYPDVAQENDNYIYVATAEEMGIAKPLDDGTFSGDAAVTNEYVLSLCGKILAEKKGYKFPDNYVEYLAFSDKDEISAGAMPYVALATQCGLVENTGSFMPKEAVTREKGAAILYKAFTLLYDTSPVTTSFSAVVGDADANRELQDLSPLQRVVVCVMITGVMALGIVVLCKKRKQQEVEMPEEDDDESEE